MADKPNNNEIEQQLQEYAKRRHEAVGTPEMHPATRQMLQAEVKQRFGATKATDRTAGWAWFWPRLAFACGAFAVLGIVAMFALPPGKKKQDGFVLAKLDEANKPQPMAAALEASPGKAAPISPAEAASDEIRVTVPVPPVVLSGDVPSATVTPVRDGNALTRRASRVEADPQLDRLVSAKAFSKQPADEEVAIMKPNTASKTDESDRIPMASAPKEARAMKSAGAWNAKSDASRLDSKMVPVVVAGQISGKDAPSTDLQQNLSLKMSSNTGQRYRNAALMKNEKKSDQLTVLDEFTVAQNGEVLTIVDRDGSIYNGFARLAPESRQNFAGNNRIEHENPVQSVPNTGNGGRAGAALDQRAMNRAFVQTQNAPATTLDIEGQSQVSPQSQLNFNAIEMANYDFRVEGTNRSLNQRVVFTGNISHVSQNGMVSLADNNLQTGSNVSNSQTFRQQQNVTQFNQSYSNNGQQLPTMNNYINGRVVVGNKREVELNALPASQ